MDGAAEGDLSQPRFNLVPGARRPTSSPALTASSSTASPAARLRHVPSRLQAVQKRRKSVARLSTVARSLPTAAPPRGVSVPAVSVVPMASSAAQQAAAASRQTAADAEDPADSATSPSKPTSPEPPVPLPSTSNPPAVYGQAVSGAPMPPHVARSPVAISSVSAGPAVTPATCDLSAAGNTYPDPAQVAATGVDDEAVLDAIAASTPSDTQVALMTLRAEWPGDSIEELSRLPPIVLLSQLYSLVADRAAVDREIDAMRATNVVRFLQLSAVGPADYAIVLTDDLRSVVRKFQRLKDAPLEEYFETLLPKCTDMSITQETLDHILGVDVDYATVFVRGGLLTVRDDTSFWFSLPSVGYFLKVRSKGSDELVGILRRAPYSEMLLAKLEIRRLRSSTLPAIFHIRDVIGNNVAETTSTTLGTLVKLRVGAGYPFVT